MKNAKEFCSGAPPGNLEEEIKGLEKALKATEKRIRETKDDNLKKDLEKHRQDLLRRLEEARKKST